MQKIDVVIAYYKQHKDWPLVADGLVANKRFINRIFVVNDEEEFEPPLNTYGLPVEFLGHTHEGFGVCKSFNQGVRAASTERVFITTADCVMPPGYLRAFLALPHALVAGPVHHVSPVFPYPNPTVLRTDSFAHMVGDPEYRPWQYVRGAAKLVQRVRFLDMGGFDERYDERNYEDYDFTARWCTAYGDDTVGYCDRPIWHLGDPGRYDGPPPEKSYALLCDVLRDYEVARLQRMKEVIVDFDDLCDNTAHTLDVLDELKAAHPNFKCTLFTIPARCSAGTLQKVDELNAKYGAKFIQLAPHGWRHTRGECLAWTSEEAAEKIKAAADMGIDAPLFKAPAWLLDGETYEACKQLGYTVYNPAHLAITNYVHGHLSDTTGNYIGTMKEQGKLEFGPDHIFQWPQEVV